jgi:hypothetical protein
MAMGRMPMVEGRHLLVFEVLYLRTVVVAVHGIVAAAAAVVGVAGPVPVGIDGAKEMRRSSGGFRCLQI